MLPIPLVHQKSFIAYQPLLVFTGNFHNLEKGFLLSLTFETFVVWEAV